MNSSSAQDDLRQLTEKTSECNHELIAYSSIRQNISDNDTDSISPIFDSFYNSGGDTAIVKMINFTPIEYRKVYSALEETNISNLKVGRGRNYNQSPINVSYITLVVLNHGVPRDFLGSMFWFKGPTFTRLITGFTEKIEEKCVDKCWQGLVVDI